MSKSEISVNGTKTFSSAPPALMQVASDSAKGDRGMPSSSSNSIGGDKAVNSSSSNNHEEGRENGENEKDDMVVIDQSIKHPLENSWTLWFFKNDRSREWNDNQREITTFSTVEDFWALYNHIEVASRIPSACDYSMFKAGIKPMWEDPLNQHGGKWLLVLLKRQKGDLLDCIWLDILMGLVGEGFGHLGKHVNGAVVSVKASMKIALWLGSNASDDEINQIGHKFRELMRLDQTYGLTYENHTESMNKMGSMARCRFRI